MISSYPNPEFSFPNKFLVELDVNTKAKPLGYEALSPGLNSGLNDI